MVFTAKRRHFNAEFGASMCEARRRFDGPTYQQAAADFYRDETLTRSMASDLVDASREGQVDLSDEDDTVRALQEMSYGKGAIIACGHAAIAQARNDAARKPDAITAVLHQRSKGPVADQAYRDALNATLKRIDEIRRRQNGERV